MFYVVTFTDGFNIALSSKNEILNSTYEDVMLTINVDNYKDKTLLKPLTITGYDKNNISSYKPTSFSEYKNYIPLELQQTYKQLDFMDTYNSLENMSNMLGMLFFNSSSNLDSIYYDDGVHQCNLLFAKSEPTTTNINSNNNIASLTNKSELQNYLENNYSSLKTSKGETSFEFTIYENNSIIRPHDYWILVNYNSQFFYDLRYSNQWTNEDRMKVKQELKDFMEKLGRDVIEKMPSKKLYGHYYNYWYKYPALRIGYNANRYYSWTNYDDIEDYSSNAYELAKPSTFRWYDFIDDEL
jgi:hypothetical protein